MSYNILTIVDTYKTREELVAAFELRLRQALADSCKDWVVELHTLLYGGSALIDWLAVWTKKFTAEHKMVLWVSASPEQSLALEYSHPDLHLLYVNAMHEIPWQQHAQAEMPVAVAVTAIEVKPVNPLIIESPPAPIEIVIKQPDSVSKPVEEEKIATEPIDEVKFYRIPEITIAPGDMVPLAGEYECRRCHNTRMWIKGDTVGKCENSECPQPLAGWALTCELF